MLKKAHLRRYGALGRTLRRVAGDSDGLDLVIFRTFMGLPPKLDGRPVPRPHLTNMRRLLREDLVGPLDQADECGRVGEAGILANQIGIQDPTGP